MVAISQHGIEATRDIIPPWVQDYLEETLVNAGLLPVGFINSVCDTQRLLWLWHVDDPQRFARSTYSLRLFGDSRLTPSARCPCHVARSRYSKRTARCR